MAVRKAQTPSKGKPAIPADVRRALEIKVDRLVRGKAKVTSKGQVTIPAEIRRALDIKKGDRLVFELRPEGLRVRKAATVSSLIGSVPPLKVDWKTARRMAWKARAERIMRSSATRTSSSDS